jgi:hypothetical protein
MNKASVTLTINLKKQWLLALRSHVFAARLNGAIMSLFWSLANYEYTHVVLQPRYNLRR